MKKIFRSILLLVIGLSPFLGVSFVYADDGSKLTKTHFLLIFLFILAIISFISKQRIRKMNKNKHEKRLFEDIKDKEFEIYFEDIKIKDLKKIIYDNYTNIKSSISNFDYEKLRELCTDELYHEYTETMEKLKKDGKQNVMKAFKNKQLNITRVYSEKNVVTIMVYINLSYLNYFINSKNEELISGSKIYDIEEGNILYYIYDRTNNKFLLKQEKKED